MTPPHIRSLAERDARAMEAATHAMEEATKRIEEAAKSNSIPPPPHQALHPFNRPDTHSNNHTPHDRKSTVSHREQNHNNYFLEQYNIINENQMEKFKSIIGISI